MRTSNQIPMRRERKKKMRRKRKRRRLLTRSDCVSQGLTSVD